MNATNGTLSRGVLAALLALTVVAGATGLAAAAGTATIDADPGTPDSTATHTVTQTVGSDVASASWTGYKVTYGDDTVDVSNVSTADVQTIGIDRGDDASGATVDVNVSDDLDAVSSSNNGATLSLSLGGSYSLNESDQVVVVYDNATNPAEAGDYDVSVDINPQSSGGETSATLSIAASSDSETTTSTTSTETTTTTSTETTTTTSTETSTTTTSTASTTQSGGDSTTSSETTSGGSPGLGAGLALVAFAGAGLVAARKR